MKDSKVAQSLLLKSNRIGYKAYKDRLLQGDEIFSIIYFIFL